MQNLTKTLDSGAVLNVSMAPFEVGHKLFKVVGKELTQIKFAFGNAEVEDLGKLKDLLRSDDAVDTIKNIILRLVSSDDVEDALWACMAYADYDKKKVIKTNNIFDSAEARGDYLVVAKEVLWFNLSPFFRNLSSMLPDLQKKTTVSPSSAAA